MKINSSTHYLRNTLILIFSLLIVGCSGVQQHKDGPPKRSVDVAKIQNAVPKVEPRSQYGNPASYVVFGKCYYVMKSSKGYDKRGIASWYGTKFNHQLTSNRESYNMLAMTAASKTLPLPTYVEVTNLKNSKRIIVRVNDRGPFAKNRILDLSYVAAKKLNMLKTGTAYVEVKAIDPRTYYPNKQTPKPALKIQGHPLLYLQVASFFTQNSAYNLAEQITRILAEKTRIESIQQNQHTFYRVQIGPIASVADSDKIVQELHEKGFRNSVAIIE